MFSREQQEGEEREEEEEEVEPEVLLLFGRRYFRFLDSLQFECTVNNQLAPRRAAGHSGKAGREAEDSGGMSCNKKK